MYVTPLHRFGEQAVTRYSPDDRHYRIRRRDVGRFHYMSSQKIQKTTEYAISELMERSMVS